MSKIHGRNGRNGRMTYAEMDAFNKARAAQQLATAGASDAEFLVTPPLDVAALPTPTTVTLDEWRTMADEMHDALYNLAVGWHELYHRAEYFEDCSVCSGKRSLLARCAQMLERAQEANHANAA